MTEMTDQNGGLLDWVRETPESIKARLAGAKQLQDQLRFVLGVMAIISMMILIASYNAYWSYDYTWAVNEAEHTFGPVRTTADILTEQALRSWADSRSVTISLVGIHVNVDDAPVLGTLSLLVTSVWLFLLARRENKTIGLLLQDTDSRPISDEDRQHRSRHGRDRWLIFHTIISNSVFMNLDRSLTRIDSLRRASPGRLGPPVRPFEGGVSRALGAFFFLFPPLACLVMFGLDRWSYFRPSPFLRGAAVPGMGEFFQPSLTVFLVCWILLLVCCWRARLYVTATESVLREYWNALLEDATEAARRGRAGQPADLRSPPTHHA